ncbi:MAG: hypothetical protein PHX54_13045 [Lentimicrobiaceae bacterium]|nr:hypothetical protein [Lentimicrobiaceae bacterium]
MGEYMENYSSPDIGDLSNKRLTRLFQQKLLKILFIILLFLILLSVTKKFIEYIKISSNQMRFEGLITEDESYVRSKAMNIIEEEQKAKKYKSKQENDNEANEISKEERGLLIYEYLNRKWHYFEDPAGTEYLANPKETIENGYKGDCDDYSICLAALLKTIGLHVNLISQKNAWSGHLYPAMLVSEEFIEGYENEESYYYLTRFHYINYDEKNMIVLDDFSDEFDVNAKWLILDWRDNYGNLSYYLDDANKVVYSSLNTLSKYSFVKDISLRIILILSIFFALLIALLELGIPETFLILKDETAIQFCGTYSELLPARYLIAGEYYNFLETYRIPSLLNGNEGVERGNNVCAVPYTIVKMNILENYNVKSFKENLRKSIRNYITLKKIFTENVQKSAYGEIIVFRTLRETLEIKLIFSVEGNELYYCPMVSYKYDDVEAAMLRKQIVDKSSTLNGSRFHLCLINSLNNNEKYCEFLCDVDLVEEIIQAFRKTSVIVCNNNNT